MKPLALRKGRCPKCNGPIFKPTFNYCPWCRHYFRYVKIYLASNSPSGPGGTGLIERETPESPPRRKPYDPASTKCPACGAPVFTPAFRYCFNCGCYLLEEVLDTWDELREARRVVDLRDECIKLDLIRGESAMYSTPPRTSGNRNITTNA